MDYMNVILTTVFSLMVATNIITEVVKKITWDKLPTNILAVIVAELLTLTSGFAYAQMNNITIEWYYIVSGIVLGVFVSYASMFGFDKFKQAMDQVVKK